MMININPIEKFEHYKVLEIEKNLFNDPMTQDELNRFTSQKSFRIWKIQKDRIIGYVSFFQIKDEVEIIKIGIIRTYQRNYYGSLLIKELKKLDIKKIFLEVSSENNNAINFYYRNGFQKVGLRKRYYTSKNGPNIDALRLTYTV